MAHIIISMHSMPAMPYSGIRQSRHSDNGTTLHHMLPVGVSAHYTITRCPSFPAQSYIDGL